MMHTARGGTGRKAATRGLLLGGLLVAAPGARPAPRGVEPGKAKRLR